ncbi:MAG: hypothetical protein ABIN89_21100 [Chitinophagaceae bacterium]
MVNIIENWAFIQGIVKSVGNSGAPKGYVPITLELQNALDSEALPNLAKADEGSIINIQVKPEQIDKYAIRPGKSLSCKARKSTGQKYFLE